MSEWFNPTTPQWTFFTCCKCEKLKKEDWSKKEYPYKICNECKDDLDNSN